VPKIPGVNHLDAVRALEKAGFRILRQGKHIVMSDGIRILTVPRHKPVNAFTMGGIARWAQRRTIQKTSLMAIQTLMLDRTLV
jgi:predicted RNA binding protein YcfA (HicA-like mRNA interferase family)